MLLFDTTDRLTFSIRFQSSYYNPSLFTNVTQTFPNLSPSQVIWTKQSLQVQAVCSTNPVEARRPPMCYSLRQCAEDAKRHGDFISPRCFLNILFNKPSPRQVRNGKAQFTRPPCWCGASSRKSSRPIMAVVKRCPG